MEKSAKESNEVIQLRKIKEDNSWSYQKLAQELDVHYQTVIGWFTKGIEPSRMSKRVIRQYLTPKL